MIRSFIVLCSLALLLVGRTAISAESSVTLIHTGDFHGHLVPRADVRGAVEGRPIGTVGGLARVATVVKGVRGEVPGALLINTGDTIQGSAEALYTRGEALVAVVDMLGVDAFAPGNWEFVYGTARFLELFAGPRARARWNTIAANLFYSTAAQDATTPFPDKAGQHVLPPYIVRQVGRVKVGILGLTADRGPQILPRAVTKGFYFLPNGKVLYEETTRQVAQLRKVEKVDLLVLASEMGLANNIRIAETIPGIDVVLSSDMHEASLAPIVVTGADGRKTLLVEEGQDGAQVGRIDVEVAGGKIASWKWKRYAIDDSIAADPAVAAKIDEIRRPFVSGPGFVAQRNPFNGSVLKRPIDTVVGYSAVPLLRERFTDSTLPGVIGGSSHYMLTDAFRDALGADVGAIRGFRYGTQIPAGSGIRYEDLYHYIAIGPQLGVATVTGAQIKSQIEAAADGSLNPDVTKWTGGWLFAFSDSLRMDFDPYAPAGQRASNIRIDGKPLDPAATYRYTSYWYATDPCSVNSIPVTGCTVADAVPSNIRILRDGDGSPLDGVEAVARYIEKAPNRTVNPSLDRVRLVRPLPPPRFGSPEVQPLRGATP
ncbi:MAG TPA: 5'-nucleotidase C-terminal domain-containing protein [bacterium]|nr:5'-nucleotidase C-terminal domain-containing protein [bacterium]